MTFLMDRNMNNRVVKALRSDYRWHIDSTLIQSEGDTTPDNQVIQLAIAKQMVLLTQDRDFDEDPAVTPWVPRAEGVVLVRLTVSGPHSVPSSDWPSRIDAAYREYASLVRGNVLEVWPDGPLLRWFRAEPPHCAACLEPFNASDFHSAPRRQKSVRQGKRKATYHIADVLCTGCSSVTHIVERVTVP